MVDLEHIFSEYVRLRAQGITPKISLESLHSEIEALTIEEKEHLAQYVRDYEADATLNAASAAEGMDDGLEDEELDIRATNVNVAIQWVTCPHCGKSNQASDLICYSCGGLLVGANVETAPLAPPEDRTRSDDYFGHDSVLILLAHNSEKEYEIQPQRSKRETILGRRTHSPMTPDIDLSASDANRLGVSRLHVSIRYDARYNTVSVFDMGSANGTFINGQRLHPHEVRVLHDNDELRLGHLIMTVHYQHRHKHH